MKNTYKYTHYFLLMNVISDRVKICLEDKVRRGLSIKDMDTLILEVCDRFSSTSINPSVDPEIKLPREVIAGTSRSMNTSMGYPLPYRYSRELNLAGLNFGIISEIDGEKPQQKIYVIGTILAQLARVPRNKSEVSELENYLREDNIKMLQNRSMIKENGFILETYFKIIKRQMPLGNVLTLGRSQSMDNYPKTKELHLISNDQRVIIELQRKGIVDKNFKSALEIRPNKPYPGKILEGLRLFNNAYGNIKNSPLSLFKEGTEYIEIEINLK